MDILCYTTWIEKRRFGDLNISNCVFVMICQKVYIPLLVSLRYGKFSYCSICHNAGIFITSPLTNKCQGQVNRRRMVHPVK